MLSIKEKIKMIKNKTILLKKIIDLLREKRFQEKIEKI